MSSQRFRAPTSELPTVQSYYAGQVISAVARRLRPRQTASGSELEECLRIVADRLGWTRVQLLLIAGESGIQRAASWPPELPRRGGTIDLDAVRPLLDAATIAGCFVASRRDHRVGSRQDRALASVGSRRDEVTAVVGALEGFAGAVLVLQRGIDRPPGPAESVALEQVATLVGLAIERFEEIARRDATRALLDLAPDFVAVVDRTGILEYVSAGITAMLGHDPATWIGGDVTSAVHPDDRAIAQAMLVGDDEAEECARELRVRNAAGRWVAVEVISRSLPESIAPRFAAVGSVPNRERLVLCVRDVDDRRRLFDRVAWQASHDILTGLWSRCGLRDRVVARSESKAMSVLRIDVDRFQAVNEYFGHEIGDECIVALGNRLRSLAGQHAEVARLGADDFVVVTTAEAGPLATKCRDRLGEPVCIGSATLTNTISVGIATLEPGSDFLNSLANAELALGAARAGSAGIAWYDEALESRISRGRVLETGLRRALADGAGLSLLYQPVVDAGSRKLVGFEALARWNDEVLGSVSPSEFVPIAEATGLIQPLGRWVRRSAFSEFARWLESCGPREADLAINVSVAELTAPKWLCQLASDLDESGLSPDLVTVEVTESVFMENYRDVRDRLAGLRSLGCGVALDDFGTGYASFAHLDDLPIDALKIDRSFVQRVDRGDRRAESVVATIVRLALDLDLEVIAEGIEREGQARALAAMGVDSLQGFWFGRPQSLPREAAGP